ncbi:putative ribosome-binding factor A, mitochondrial [Drosophila biarmipes]|uniref:putative ribosome-binding factor A, mitochondrial n=1 Tax=Drosophila biarmipes TaxID=125945 RepID=UPI0007E89C9B|nr:putative ribosome-binding factor A, mitochondrial [Drosophila biarmipes]
MLAIRALRLQTGNLALNNVYQRTLLRTKSTKNTKKVNVIRQGKIFSSLFGNRLKGSSSRWYPAPEASSPAGSGNHKSGSSLHALKFGTPHSHSSRDNVRRMSVLNKVFMTNITDILATGAVADSIVGQGVQISHVKITSDFSRINVYWMGKDGSTSDVLEETLNRLSGKLQHELSQLHLMGEVPRIKFVRDKTSSGLYQVQEVLAKLDLQHKHSSSRPTGQTESEEVDAESSQAASDTEWPEMRQDFLSFNQSSVMDKILGKMRKSKDAWVQHKHNVSKTS